uniref:hypothetical protein n=1 Tax=Streptomyces paradoxus TaxID=66375 RepID=UPI0035E42423
MEHYVRIVRSLPVFEERAGPNSWPGRPRSAPKSPGSRSACRTAPCSRRTARTGTRRSGAGTWS